MIDVQPEADDEDRPAAPYLDATADREGNFRLDDVPEGKYTLVVRFYRPELNRLVALRSFSVPPRSEDRAEQDVDLAEITLKQN